MDPPMRFKIGIGVVFTLIALIIPAATLRANNAAKPMMTHDFTDVPVVGQEFMEPYINAFYHMGITGGCSVSPLMYCPTNNVTRGSIAVFMGRALGYVDMTTDGVSARAYFKQTGTGVNDHGVVGTSDNGYGVLGESTNNLGVWGVSVVNHGVYGLSQSGSGVYAYSFFDTAMVAASGAQSTTDTIYDIELGGTTGEMFGSAIHMFSNNGFIITLDKDNNTTDYFIIRDAAGTDQFFVKEDGDTTVNGNLQINGSTFATGSKSAIVDTVSHGTRAMYAVEATEVMFEDVGRGQLVEGESVIEIDPVFAETVNLNEDYEVFLTPIGDPVLLYIEAMTATSFTVRSADGSDVQFSYRIVAKRLGYEDVRMEEVTP